MIIMKVHMSSCISTQYTDETYTFCWSDVTGKFSDKWELLTVRSINVVNKANINTH